MHVGVMYPYQFEQMADPQFVAKYSQLAERLGFESLWTNEHMVVPTRIGQASWDLHGDTTFVERAAVDRPEPVQLLGHVAAVTSTIKLGTAVILLPQRNPVFAAKQIATLDRLSGGRVLLGVGVGWLSEEAQAVGTNWHDRGARMDEYIEAMRALWTNRVATYHGKYVNFDEVMCLPLAAQAGGVPIIVGGNSKAAIRRAGRLGNGFKTIGVDLDGLPAVIEQVRAAARAAGRDPDAVEISTAGVRDPAALRKMQDLGVKRVTFYNTKTKNAEEAFRDLEEIAEQVIARLA